MRRRLPLLLILLIGILTPLLSTALFFFWRPAAQVNVGVLLPPQQVATAGWRTAAGEAFSIQDWRGDWVLLAAGGGACDDACQQRLCQMRQLRLMLPGNYLRLRRVWLVTDATPPPAALMQETHCGEWEEGREITTRAADVVEGVEVLHAAANTLPAGAAHLYLVDPSGVWVMYFPPQLSIYSIRTDLKRLLRISKGRKLLSEESLNSSQ